MEAFTYICRVRYYGIVCIKNTSNYICYNNTVKEFLFLVGPLEKIIL